MGFFLKLFPLIVLFFILGWFIRPYSCNQQILNSTVQEDKKPPEKPLEVYSIKNLSKTKLESGQFSITEKLDEEKEFTSYLFEFKFQPNPTKDITKKTTGLINIPNEIQETTSIILMLRGYIDQEIYQTGMGTRRAAEEFAKEGFITIAPDFLGYAGSNQEAKNIFESRFQTYTTSLSLLQTIPIMEQFNNGTILIWGHSNGGQIALTILEITGKNYPTTLWAPVSKPFPYSVLYYTDEAEDRGKLIRNKLSEFEKDYDVEKYSLTNYLDKINSPLQVHQGGLDDAVPTSWSNNLISKLKKLDKEVTYNFYPEADHNMLPNWNTTITRDIKFFLSHLNN